MPTVRNRSGESEPRPPRGEDAPRQMPEDDQERFGPSYGPTVDTPPAPDRPKRTPTDRKLAASVAEIYQGIGVVVIGAGIQMNDAGLQGSGIKMCELAEPVSMAWLELADKNPAVKNALKKLTEVSAMGTVVVMHATMFMPLLADRGIIPAFLSPQTPPADQNGATPSN